MLTSVFFPSKFKLIGTTEELKKELKQIIAKPAKFSNMTYIIDSKAYLKTPIESLVVHVYTQHKKYNINFIFISDKYNIDKRLKEYQTCKTEVKFRDLNGKVLLCEL